MVVGVAFFFSSILTAVLLASQIAGGIGYRTMLHILGGGIAILLAALVVCMVVYKVRTNFSENISKNSTKG
jgi:hypothetical protein